jgi:DNA-binding CsgD family transcriptional regulator
MEPLSQRELEVLRLLDTELTGPEIARELYITLNTLRTHTKRIFTKLDAKTRAVAVHRARDSRRRPRRARAGAHGHDGDRLRLGRHGASHQSSAVDLPPHIDTSDQPLPDPRTRRYSRPDQPERPTPSRPVDNRGEPV